MASAAVAPAPAWPAAAVAASGNGTDSFLGLGKDMLSDSLCAQEGAPLLIVLGILAFILGMQLLIAVWGWHVSSRMHRALTTGTTAASRVGAGNNVVPLAPRPGAPPSITDRTVALLAEFWPLRLELADREKEVLELRHALDKADNKVLELMDQVALFERRHEAAVQRKRLRLIATNRDLGKVIEEMPVSAPADKTGNGFQGEEVHGGSDDDDDEEMAGSKSLVTPAAPAPEMSKPAFSGKPMPPMPSSAADIGGGVGGSAQDAAARGVDDMVCVDVWDVSESPTKSQAAGKTADKSEGRRASGKAGEDKGRKDASRASVSHHVDPSENARRLSTSGMALSS